MISYWPCWRAKLALVGLCHVDVQLQPSSSSLRWRQYFQSRLDVRIMPPTFMSFLGQELDQIVAEADVGRNLGKGSCLLLSCRPACASGHDGIDFADFLGLARTHLDLAEADL